MELRSYDDGLTMAFFEVAWRIKGMHELEGLISDEARAEIFDFLRKKAGMIGPDALEGIDRIDGKVKP